MNQGGSTSPRQWFSVETASNPSKVRTGILDASIIPEINNIPRIASNTRSHVALLKMRRALSILLMLLVGAGPLSYAFSLSDELSLPACCRRNGAHHCAMDGDQSQRAAAPAATKARSRCLQYPQHSNARTTSNAAIGDSLQVVMHVEREISCTGPAANRFTSIHLRAPVLRGPPADRLS